MTTATAAATAACLRRLLLRLRSSSAAAAPRRREARRACRSLSPPPLQQEVEQAGKGQGEDACGEREESQVVVLARLEEMECLLASFRCHHTFFLLLLRNAFFLLLLRNAFFLLLLRNASFLLLLLFKTPRLFSLSTRNVARRSHPRGPRGGSRRSAGLRRLRARPGREEGR